MAENNSMLSDIYCLLKGAPTEGRPLLLAAGTAWTFRAVGDLAALDAAACAVPLPPPPTNGGLSWLWIAAILLVVGLSLLALLVRRRRSLRPV